MPLIQPKRKSYHNNNHIILIKITRYHSQLHSSKSYVYIIPIIHELTDKNINKLSQAYLFIYHYMVACSNSLPSKHPSNSLAKPKQNLKSSQNQNSISSLSYTHAQTYSSHLYICYNFSHLQLITEYDP